MNFLLLDPLVLTDCKQSQNQIKLQHYPHNCQFWYQVYINLILNISWFGLPIISFPLSISLFLFCLFPQRDIMEEKHCFSVLITVSQVGLSVEGREFSFHWQARDRANLTVYIVTLNKVGGGEQDLDCWAEMAVTITFGAHFLQIVST